MKITVENLIDILSELSPSALVHVGNITNGRSYHYGLNSIKCETDMLTGNELVFLMADRDGVEVVETFKAEDKEG